MVNHPAGKISMRTRLLFLILGLAALTAVSVKAQTTPGVTATCKDGSSFSGTTRSGACRGHGGVGTWGSTSTATTTGSEPAAKQPASTQTGRTQTANASPAQTPNTAPDTRAAAPAPSKTAAKPGGGSGQVWVNSSSKIYHCEGDRYYGKTKSGTFMSESAAKAAGDRPSGGKTCS
jgi:hypothetical protein